MALEGLITLWRRICCGNSALRSVSRIGPPLGAYVAASVSLRLCATLPLAYFPASVSALRKLAPAASGDVLKACASGIMPITRQRSKTVSGCGSVPPHRQYSNSPPGPRSLDPPSTSPGPTDRRITRSLSRARSASANDPSLAVRLFSGMQSVLAEVSTSSGVSRGLASRDAPVNSLAVDRSLPATAPELGSVGGAASEAQDRSAATPNHDRPAARDALYLAKTSLAQQLHIKKLRLLSRDRRKVVGLEGYGLEITDYVLLPKK